MIRTKILHNYLSFSIEEKPPNITSKNYGLHDGYLPSCKVYTTVMGTVVVSSTTLDYTTVIYRRVKFTRRLDNRSVISIVEDNTTVHITVVVSQYYTTVYTVVESRNVQ